jgi:hypothetical protein
LRKDLLRWQWELYPDGHTRRVTLVLHALTAPSFMSGTVLVATSPLVGWRAAISGLVLMLVALAAQGWTHKREAARPVPFDGPLDFVSRFFVEQWITFPRFVFSGKFAAVFRHDG